MNLKNPVELFEDDIYQVLEPKTAVARRNSAGGTGFEQIKIAIDKGKRLFNRINQKFHKQ